MNQTNAHDELSLRDFYLILRKGLPIIIIFSLLAGIITFIIVSFQPRLFKAESTTLITPPAIEVQGIENLSFTPSSQISFETYETLANSRPVIEAALENAEETDMTFKSFSGTVTQLIGPSKPNETAALSVTHSLKHQDPEQAAVLADAWAQETLETLRISLLANLEPISTSTEEQVSDLRAKLRESDEALEQFEQQDASSRLTATIETLADLIADAEGELVTLSERSLTDNEQILGTSKVNLAQEIRANEAILESLRQQSAPAQDIIFRQAWLSGLQGRQALLQEQLNTYTEDFQKAQTQLASLNKQRRELERDVSNAQTTYESVVSLQPFINYLTQLAPTNARFLSQASVPLEPVASRKLISAVLAALITAIIIMVFIFLQDAVRAPASVEESKE